MRSPVSWALLGLLIDRPDYGYNLFHRFQRAYGDTLELSTPSQIYAGLNGLESNGLIERLPSEHPSPDTERQQKAELQPKAERQPKPRYGASEQGQRSYRERLIAQACDKHKQTRLFILQLASSEPDTALAVLDAYEQYHLKASPAAPGQASPAASDIANRLIEAEERLALDGILSWIQYVRGEFETRASAPQQRLRRLLIHRRRQTPPTARLRSARALPASRRRGAAQASAARSASPDACSVSSMDYSMFV